MSAGIDQLDTLSVKVLPEMFELERFTNYTQTYKEQETSEAKINLPRQMPSSKAQEILESAVGTAKGSVMVFSSSNLVLGIFFSGLLQFTWSMVNSLQLITHTALFSIVMPSNAQIFMFALLSLGNLDVANQSSMMQTIIGIEDP